MVDQEVQNILQEIRERVRSGNAQETSLNPTPEPLQLEPDPLPDFRFASLSTMDRTWNRLPPVITNRSGTTARLELWIKTQIKRALRWITWEQVNFNAAVHHTQREIIESLVAYEQRLRQYEQRLKNHEQRLGHHEERLALHEELSAGKVEANQLESLRQEVVGQVYTNSNDSRLLRIELLAEIAHRREEIVAHQQELNLLRTEITAHRREIIDIAETQFLELVARCEALQTQRNEVAAEITALQTNFAAWENQNQLSLESFGEQLSAFEENRLQTQSRLTHLLAELRQRDDRLLEEQRVCFKQLSLEASEAAVLKDRIYRDLVERVAKLETNSHAEKQSA